jgi:transcription elongation factor SPT6
LDEILAWLVRPMATNAKDLILNKYYRQANGGNSEELKNMLQEEKTKNPKRIPYLFSASKQLPGKFLLAYQPSSKSRIEYVTVTPDGFRYRNRVHESINGLLKWFKEHFQESVPRPVQMSSSSSVGGDQIPPREH